MQHRYAGLGYIAMNVSDLDRSAAFYEKLWGLQPNGRSRDGSLFFRCGPDHHDLMLCSGEPGLKRIAWQMESGRDLNLLAERLRGLGHAVVPVDSAEAADLRLDRAMRFSDPYTGATHEYFVTMERAAEDWSPTLASIQRIGHVVLSTPRYEEALAFYRDVLNFRTSDVIDGRVSFLRCFPNPLHHSIGLGNSSRRALHHVNFMVEEIDDIGRAIWRFNKNDVPIVRGPGRHPPSGSVFLYVLDPDGITVEYSYGMEEFPEVGAREHRVLPPVPESIDYWDGPTDPRLGKVGTIEPL
ncbi:VOC family protein [Rhizorhabdus dicambivorans]|uniref:Bleomycin resistance protein n=1 Tax=Rhizorhabdus dicambivorans TaxID=1850238 RepID=A0A2A4FWK5_9SPHN|nr:VOC family protein [Rhizorhabdus dicambivorans]ATE66163.1 bleomycin resistance protein [Rhizorhabdus dicambivorans]PCE42089.1 bleomycin resistance protein [Rhizorhabdus dicambivorans]